MRIVKRILIAIAIIFLIPLVLALFTRKEYTVAREVVVNKPDAEVFNYIKHLKNQDNYSKWVMADPNMKKEYKGIDGTEGFVYAWDGNEEAGEGEQEIKKITEGRLVATEIRFVRPFEGVADAEFHIQPAAAGQSKVIWQFHSAMPYPANALLLFVNMDNMMGKDMDTSLSNLKKIIER